MTVKVLKQKSLTRKREKDGKSFVDFYIAWVYEGKNYEVRVRPQFFKDFDKLYAIAEEVPVGEMLAKYM